MQIPLRNNHPKNTGLRQRKRGTPMSVTSLDVASGLDRKTREWVYPPSAFSRLDEEDDAEFYKADRMVSHIDRTARDTVSSMIASLIVERRPRVLDLMASWDSHLPADLETARTVGLGLNLRELEANPRLDEHVIHDLNADPQLPFADSSFDVALNTVSVDYMTRPFEVFAEVARVLVPGGLYLVTFSNRMFDRKAIQLWRRSTEQERVLIVEDYFRASQHFTEPGFALSVGRPRPVDDRYAGLGLPSDPIYAVWADKRGASARRRPRTMERLQTKTGNPAELKRRLRAVSENLRCPHCDSRLSKWAVPQTPFTESASEVYRVCFNDRCPHLLAGWDAMAVQGNRGLSHRFMYDPDLNACGSLPVPDLWALRESIVAED
jgi:SAM-dependent methyltransferase